MTEITPDVFHVAPLPEDSWAPINLNTLPDKPPIEPVLGGTGLIYPGKRHVFSGPPESAKTLAAYAILIVVARTGGTGILIDFEMGIRDAKKRLQELGATPAEIDHIPYIEPDSPATPARLQNLIELEPQLVVIDAAAGAYQIEGYDDNKRSDVEKFSRLYVGAFWLAGIATIIIDHVVKAVEGRGKFVIGSERKLGSSDVHLGFDTITPISRGTSGRYKITTHKDRGGCLKRGHIADLEINSDPDTHMMEWRFMVPSENVAAAGYFRPTHLMHKVSEYLSTQTEPVTRSTIHDALGARKEYVLKAVDALVIEGFATETDGPKRSKLIQSIRRYNEHDPVDNSVDNPDGSVVPSGSPVVPGTIVSSGSPSSSLLRRELGKHSRPDHPEQPVWFHENGRLIDAYYDEIKPDDDIPF